MALVAGTRLGIYEIVAPLGAGGMGEFHRARDTRLGRDVAIKVLPVDVSSSPERLARFEREARVVASLNHPNIVTLHSIDEALDTRFLVIELIEGRSFAEGGDGGVRIGRRERSDGRRAPIMDTPSPPAELRTAHRWTK